MAEKKEDIGDKNKRVNDYYRVDVNQKQCERLSGRYSWIKDLDLNKNMKGYFFLGGVNKDTIVCSMIVEKKDDGLWLIKFDTDNAFVSDEQREEFFEVQNRLLKADHLKVKKTNQTDYLMYKRYGFKNYTYDKNNYFMKK